MTRKRMVLWGGLGLALAALVIVIGLNTLGRYTGVTVPQLAPETVERLLVPHMRITTPPGDGPFPTALLFSGCDGPQDNLDTWAQTLAARGWASIMVDSHTPRGFIETQLWRLICAGQLLTGAERAGDIAVAVAHARTLPFVDPARLALIGASHGGWSVLEYLSMADQGRPPLSLERWPGDADPLAGIAGVVLFYPYCGELSRVSRRGWDSAIPVLFLLVEDDPIASERDCLVLAAREQSRDLPVDLHLYTGVTHAFDVRVKGQLSIFEYDAPATEDAMARMAAFLTGPLP